MESHLSVEQESGDRYPVGPPFFGVVMLIENSIILCKCCGKETKHMDLGQIRLRWKCFECGEYNQKSTLSEEPVFLND